MSEPPSVASGETGARAHRGHYAIAPFNRRALFIDTLVGEGHEPPTVRRVLGLGSGLALDLLRFIRSLAVELAQFPYSFRSLRQS